MRELIELPARHPRGGRAKFLGDPKTDLTPHLELHTQVIPTIEFVGVRAHRLQLVVAGEVPVPGDLDLEIHLASPDRSRPRQSVMLARERDVRDAGLLSAFG